jgi:hypothetical protein
MMAPATVSAGVLTLVGGWGRAAVPARALAAVTAPTAHSPEAVVAA